MGQYEDCISTADKALEDHLENATIWGLRGKAYLLLVETLTLLSYLYMYMSPELSANALFFLKKFEDAIASFDRSLSIRPDFAEALSKLFSNIE